MSSSVVTQVAALLEEQAALYGDLLSLARKKQELLVAGGGSEFEAVLQGEQALILKAGRLEEKRLALQSRMADVLGISPENTTISRLIEVSDAPIANRLKDLCGQIRSILDELKRTNDLNMKLLQRSLTYIQSMFQAVGRRKKSAVYSEDGRYSPPDKRHRLDQQL